ncbi:unnamed protein product [Effrenium voratum]|nr:unnamed protein product [Effrenium voratum]
MVRVTAHGYADMIGPLDAGNYQLMMYYVAGAGSPSSFQLCSNSLVDLRLVSRATYANRTEEWMCSLAARDIWGHPKPNPYQANPYQAHQLAPNQPAPHQPAPHQPAPHQPVPSQPVQSQPVQSQPVQSQPVPNATPVQSMPSMTPSMPNFMEGNRFQAQFHEGRFEAQGATTQSFSGFQQMPPVLHQQIQMEQFQFSSAGVSVQPSMNMGLQPSMQPGMQPGMQPDMPGMPGMQENRMCSCGQPALLLTVKKEGPNQGRCFFKCARQHPEPPCPFFEWADEPPRTGKASFGGGNAPSGSGQQQGQPGPNCPCGQPSVGFNVRKDGPNQGRLFFKCAAGQCGYFQWGDQEPDPLGPPCACGVPSVRRIVQKEGQNKGRPFNICMKRSCDFFAWGDEEPRAGGALPTPVRAPRGEGGGGGGDVCFQCNQPGHWASACPNKAGGAPKGKGRGRGRGRGRGKKASAGFDGDFDGFDNFESDTRFMPY